MLMNVAIAEDRASVPQFSRIPHGQVARAVGIYVYANDRESLIYIRLDLCQLGFDPLRVSLDPLPKFVSVCIFVGENWAYCKPPREKLSHRFSKHC